MMAQERLHFYTYENEGELYKEQVGARLGAAILTAVRLRAETDHHDTPVSKKTVYAFSLSSLW